MDHATLLRLAHYAPETGAWTALVRIGRHKAGSRLEYRSPGDYCRLRIDGSKKHLAHRLAWFYMTGTWPAHDIDHKNHDRQDNRWANLREATRQQNAFNQLKATRNSSGYKGVSWDAATCRWQAHIRAEGRSIRLGRFSSLHEAAEAYRKAAQSYFGEFHHV